MDFDVHMEGVLALKEAWKLDTLVVMMIYPEPMNDRGRALEESSAEIVS